MGTREQLTEAWRSAVEKRQTAVRNAIDFDRESKEDIQSDYTRRMQTVDRVYRNTIDEIDREWMAFIAQWNLDLMETMVNGE